jgi:capsular exopolysaccharide synthesis family protein
MGLVVAQRPRSALAESFRTIRTNAQLVLHERSASFVVTSPEPSEGKTTVACNLAVAIAQSGATVLCVDADLRRPNVAPTFGIEGAVGLSDVLVGKVGLDEAIQPWPAVPGLDILPGGSIPPNPSELLGSQEMKDLLIRLKGRYDLAVFDCAPLLPVTDPIVLSAAAGGAILVAACGQTHKTALDLGIRAITAGGAHLLGVVLNKVPTRGADAYASRYGYYHSYVSDDEVDISGPPQEPEPEPEPKADAVEPESTRRTGRRAKRRSRKSAREAKHAPANTTRQPPRPTEDVGSARVVGAAKNVVVPSAPKPAAVISTVALEETRPPAPAKPTPHRPTKPAIPKSAAAPDASRDSTASAERSHTESAHAQTPPGQRDPDRPAHPPRRQAVPPGSHAKFTQRRGPRR